MRMMGERRAPSVKNGGDADPGAEVLGVGTPARLPLSTSTFFTHS
jgi:hypothetical protein